MTMASIPLQVLLKIEAQRPDLAPLIHDLMATNDPRHEAMLEQRLAAAYFSGVAPLTPSDLTAEETHHLSACCAGRSYGDVDKSSLH